MKKVIIICSSIILLILAVALVCFGQTKIGYLGLSLMLVGLAIILALLFQYNKKYR